jgi:RNA polymerase subunit RPABC4/transcription elongation factor Spt4
MAEFKFCKNCGRKVSLNGQLCARCGADLGAPAPPPSTSQGPSGYQKPYAPPPKPGALGMKKKMSWITIVLIIWLVVRIIFTTLGLPSDITLLNSAYLSDAGLFALGGAVILLALYVITLVGIYAHYNQEPAAPPIRWGPHVGFIAVLVDVVAGLVVAGIVANFISTEYFYYESSRASAMAGLTASTIWGIIMDGILAALLYVEYKREGQTGQQAAAQPARTFCTNCGTAMSPGAKFCEHCGQRIEATATLPLQPQPSEPLRTSPTAPTQYTPPAAQQGRVTQAVKAVIAGSVLAFVMLFVMLIIIAVVLGVLSLPIEFILLSFCLGPLVGTFISTYYIIDTESVPLAGVIGGIAAALSFIIFGWMFLRHTPYVLIETVGIVVSGAIGGALGKYRRDRKRLKREQLNRSI